MTDSEREDLSNLVKHPGWLRFLDHAKKEWGGSAYGQRVKQTIAKAIAEKSEIGVAVQIIDGQNDAINALMSWPTERLRWYEREAAKTP